MSSFNKAIIMGHFTRDPEIRYTPNGTAVANFCLALNHNWTDQQGEKREEVSFIDCDAWGQTAELIGKYLKKGKPLMVEGRLKQDTWEDKETGQKRSRVKVVAERITFVGSKQDDNGGGGNRRGQDRQTRNAEAPQPDSQDTGYQQNEEEDVPF